jgi:hypothetical protein
MKRASEAHFQQQVVQLAGAYGWRTYHTHDSRRSQPGFPDLVLVRDAELIFAELKTDKGRVRPEQAEWIKALQQVSSALAGVFAFLKEDIGVALPAAVDVYIWRPADFDELHARLARGRHRHELLYRQEANAA